MTSENLGTSVELSASPKKPVGAVRFAVAKHFTPHIATALLLALATLVIATRFHLWFAFPHSIAIGWDEAYVGSFALRLMNGHWLPYVDAVSQRGPLLYWIVALFQLIFGRYSFLGMRIGALLATWLIIASCTASGIVARRPLAGAIASVFYVFSVCVAFPGGQEMGGENIAAPFLTCALLLEQLAIRDKANLKRCLRLLFACGVLCALAGLTKQTTMAAIPAFLIWAVGAATPRTGGRFQWKLPVAICAGVAIPWLVVLAIYGFSGHLTEFYYWFWQFNIDVYMAPYREISKVTAFFDWLNRSVWLVFPLVVLLITGAAIALSRIKTFSPRGLGTAIGRNGLELVIAVQATLLTAAAFSTLRFWEHYFVPGMPWIGLLIGMSTERAFAHSLGIGRWLGRGALALGLTAFLGVIVWRRIDEMNRERSRGGWEDGRLDPICGAIQAHSAPTDSILVWGFDGDIPVLCKRKPASRLVFMHYVVGIVPPFWSDPRPERTARGALQMLLEDITTNRPALIVDLPQRLSSRSIMSVPELATPIQQSYCKGIDVVGNYGRRASLWYRKDQPDCAGK